MANKSETVVFKNYTRKIKLTSMIYSDFKSILVSENNEKQNPDEPYKNKYWNHIGCSFAYKLCPDDQFSRSFKSYLGQDTAHKFITNMTQENKCYSRVTKKHFNKNNL